MSRYEQREQRSCRYFNRELSWLEFNQRVLDEACDPVHPLLERLKFLAITGSNLDEFFMVRVGGLQILRNRGVTKRDPAGMDPAAAACGDQPAHSPDDDRPIRLPDPGHRTGAGRRGHPPGPRRRR